MDFRILGPLEIKADDGTQVTLPTGQRRALLIDLLLHANEIVSVDRLLDDLWGEQPPTTAEKIVQLHVSQIRRALGRGRLERQSPGYLLAIQPGELDADRAREAAARAPNLDAVKRIALLHEAVGLWRGPSLIDVQYQAFAQNEIDRLDELRLSLEEQLFEAQLEAGHHREAVGDLEALTGMHPLREHLRALLMLALYRSGRQADALEVYRVGRSLLTAELGLEPGPELQRLERRILEHDPDLAAPDAFPAALPRRSPKTLAAVAGVALAAAVSVTFLLWPRAAPARPAANAVLLVNGANGRVEKAFRVGSTPRAITLDGPILWTGNFGDHTVTRLDTRNGDAVTVGVSAPPTAIAADRNATWVASHFSRQLIRLDPTSAQAAGSALLTTAPDAVALSGSAVWTVSEEAGTLTRVDATTMKVVVVLRDLRGPSAITFDGQALWIDEAFSRRLIRVEPQTLEVTSFPLTLTPGAIAAGCGSVWLANPGEGEVTEFNLTSHQTRLIAVGESPIAVAAADNSAWVINDLSHSAQQIRCSNGALQRTITYGSNAVGAAKLSPTAVAAHRNNAWITLQSFGR